MDQGFKVYGKKKSFNVELFRRILGECEQTKRRIYDKKYTCKQTYIIHCGELLEIDESSSTNGQRYTNSAKMNE